MYIHYKIIIFECFACLTKYKILVRRVTVVGEKILTKKNSQKSVEFQFLDRLHVLFWATRTRVQVSGVLRLPRFGIGGIR